MLTILSLTIEQHDENEEESFAFRGETTMPMGLSDERAHGSSLTLDEAAEMAHRYVEDFTGCPHEDTPTEELSPEQALGLMLCQAAQNIRRLVNEGKLDEAKSVVVHTYTELPL